MSSTTIPMLPQVQAQPAPIFSYQQQNVNTLSKGPAADTVRLRIVRYAMGIFAGCQMGCSLLILIMGSACIAVSTTYEASYCYDATHLYCSVIALVASILGLVFVCCPTKDERCTLIAYFVMSIIGAVAAIGPLTTGALFAAREYYKAGDYGGKISHESYGKFQLTILGLNSVALTAGATIGILFIVSSALTCYLWSEVGCCRVRKPQSQTVTLMVVQQPGQSSNPVASMPVQVTAESKIHLEPP